MSRSGSSLFGFRYFSTRPPPLVHYTLGRTLFVRRASLHRLMTTIAGSRRVFSITTRSMRSDGCTACGEALLGVFLRRFLRDSMLRIGWGRVDRGQRADFDDTHSKGGDVIVGDSLVMSRRLYHARWSQVLINCSMDEASAAFYTVFPLHMTINSTQSLAVHCHFQFLCIHVSAIHTRDA